MLPRGKNGYSLELNSGKQDSEVRLNSFTQLHDYLISNERSVLVILIIKLFYIDYY